MKGTNVEDIRVEKTLEDIRPHDEPIKDTDSDMPQNRHERRKQFHEENVGYKAVDGKVVLTPSQTQHLMTLMGAKAKAEAKAKAKKKAQKLARKITRKTRNGCH